ncbi:MAG: M16 family metallopeptidase [Sphingomonadaceae bacterium]
MRRSVLSAFLAAALGVTAVTPLAALQPIATAAAPVPVAELVSKVDIPHEEFTLPNGLRVIVHTDRKAPVVAVSIWYHVGSKDEPKGKTGFAHLFEHLMFNGSENAPGDYFEPMQQIGATDMNGTTWFDRTNYFQTVPTGALETALFLESDRMGWLLGAVTQEKLDNQRGVVQNEKRQGDNQPYGLVEYAQLAALFPEGHPYHHSTIGSMADLDAASLADVKDWFRAKYGPNNAVLVLAGDIDVPTARRLVTKYFGNIPRGPAVTPAAASVPTLPAPKTETMKDQVATTRIYRNWVVPGLTDPDIVPLDIFASVLGGLASSRLDNALVRQEKTAVAVSASVQPFERVSLFEATVDVKPGVDAGQVATRLDAIIADLLRTGPTADEVQRVATREVAGRINGLESVGGFGGKAVALAEGAIYAGDADFYKKQLAQYAATTPEQVAAVARKWLSRPVYSLTVEPGERSPYDEAKASQAGATHRPAYYRDPNAKTPPPAPGPKMPVAVDRTKLPEMAEIKDLEFPTVEHATLRNGIDVAYVRREGVPVTRLSVSFDAGNAADPKDKLGLQALTLALLDEGTKTRSSIQIAEEKERLGAAIGASASMDRTAVGLSALTPNFAASVDLLADIIRNPAFAPEEVERVRAQQLTGIAAEMTEPRSIAMRTLPPLLYGAAYPYGVPFTGTGDPEVVKTVTREDMIAFKQKWLRPDKARIFVVSDAPLADLLPALNASLGTWKAKGKPGTKDFSAAIPEARPRVVLIDRPGSPQSVILGGQILPIDGKQEIIDLLSANDVLGGNFLSRMNMNLRETKGWAYGVRGSVSRVAERMPYIVYAPVQADKTGASIAELLKDMNAFLTTKGVTPAELERTVNGSIRELPGSFETSADVLGGMERNALFGRPDDYYDHVTALYRKQTIADLDKAARAVIDPAKMLWVVVGDAKSVRPQLDALGMAVQTMTADAAAKGGK